MRFFVFFIKNISGTAVLESAITLPFIMILSLGAIEFGFFIDQIQFAQAAVQDAARYMARVPIDCSFKSSTLNQYAPTAQNLVLYGQTTTGSTSRFSGASVQISYTTVNNGSTTTCETTAPSTYKGGAMIYLVKVTLSNFKPQGLGLLKSIVAPTFSVTSEERMLGG